MFEKMKKLFAVLLLAAFLPALAAFSLPDDGRRIITLNGDSVEFTGSGISVSGTQITLTEPGEYYVTGTLNDGTIFINTGASTEKISLILDSASITCLSGPAIYVQQAEKLRLCMAEGTENTITSGTPDMADTFDDSRSGGAIFAEDDMDIKGPGSLTVYGYINNGVHCKDDIDVDGGTVTINAVNNGIRGSESVELNDGTLNITCGNDGLKATSLKTGKGYVEINGGITSIACEGDGISASTDVIVTGGRTEIFAGKDTVKYGGTIHVLSGELIENGTPHPLTN